MNMNLAEKLARMLPDRLGKHSLRVGTEVYYDALGELPLAQAMQASAAGYLHDTVEEGYMTLTGIHTFFGDKIADAVDAVTRYDVAETYEDYIKRAAAHPIGRLVKIADIRDNLKDLPPELESLRARYEAALKELAGN